MSDRIFFFFGHEFRKFHYCETQHRTHRRRSSDDTGISMLTSINLCLRWFILQQRRKSRFISKITEGSRWSELSVLRSASIWQNIVSMDKIVVARWTVLSNDVHLATFSSEGVSYAHSLRISPNDLREMSNIWCVIRIAEVIRTNFRVEGAERFVSCRDRKRETRRGVSSMFHSTEKRTLPSGLVMELLRVIGDRFCPKRAFRSVLWISPLSLLTNISA